MRGDRSRDREAHGATEFPVSTRDNCKRSTFLGLDPTGMQGVDTIMNSKMLQQGRTAIVITRYEDDFSDSGQPGTGCCGADPGGGHVPTIVFTNHSHKHVVDSTPYNHYSLLLTLEQTFGLRCLQHACDAAAGVKRMTPLFNPKHKH